MRSRAASPDSGLPAVPRAWHPRSRETERERETL